MSSIIISFMFLLVLRGASFQVCNETRSIFREIPETYRFSYIETYEEPCLIFCSVKTRTSVNVTTRMVQRFENVTVSVCCEGYVEDYNHEGNGLYCKPVCDPPCEDGFCRNPNQCACEAGYALDPLSPHVCKPLCLEGCEIHDCISTKTPQCFSNSSYERISNNQSPVCREPCVNSICVGPDICQCFPGYHQISTYVCKPTSYSATVSCDHGTLYDPFTCLCDQGWQWKCGMCQPICNGCDHGTCLSPGQCECNPGYAIERGKCEPQCSNGCTNGKCISPELCSCNIGWYKTKEGDCKAHCDMNCENGNCVAPNVCECHTGYQLYINNEYFRCLPNSKDCEGSTSEPEACICEAPYEVRFFAENGGDCDCIGACFNSSKICTKATCLYMDLAFDMNPPELDYDHDTDEKPETNPSLEKSFNTKSDDISTILTGKLNENIEAINDTVISPVLDYDYDSDEEEEEENEQMYSKETDSNTKSNEIVTPSKVNKSTDSANVSESTPKYVYGSDKDLVRLTNLEEYPDIKHDNISMILTSKIKENSTKINTSSITPEKNDNKEKKNIQISKDTIATKEESTLPNVERIEIPEATYIVTTAQNSNNAKEKRHIDILKLHVYWISGAVIVGVLIVLLVLALVVKRICYKKHSLKSSDKNDVIVHYTNKIS